MCRSLIAASLLLLIAHPSQAAPTVGEVLRLPDPNIDRDVPKKLHPDGEVVASLAFKDKKGTNWVLFSKLVRSRRVKGAEVGDARLFVHHVRQAKKGKMVLVRKVMDVEKGCEYDLSANFVAAAQGVTDLDKNGVGEISFAYTLNCSSDVSPAVQKLLILQDGKKQILRGTTRVQVGEKKFIGGTFKPSPAAPRWNKAQLKHAKKLWKAITKAD